MKYLNTTKEQTKTYNMEQEGTIRIEQPKRFVIDFDKVTTLEDVVAILKGMDLRIQWYAEDCPEQAKEMYEKGLLIEDTRTNTFL